MKKNGFFQIINEENRTLIKVFPAQHGGERVKIDEIGAYLTRYGFKDYNLSELKEKLFTSNVVFESIISEKKLCAAKEKMEVVFDKQRRVVAAKFYPPSSDGTFMTKQDIMDDLHHHGVVYGILEKNIDVYLKNRQYGMNIFLAKAKMPVDGKDASIEYFFECNNTSKPKLNEDGSVDFHKLDMMSKVKKGDVLARLTPADYGTPGKDVMGNKIIPKKVKTLKLKKTNQTELSDDNLTLYSLVSGHVTLVEDKIFVSDTYEVAADVDAGTGDVNYEGNVTVKGNVRTGYSIKAKGNIVVNGVVEGANLYSEGDIILKRGIQGMNRGSLEAKGNIVTKFIENSSVKSYGCVQTEAIMHSKIQATDCITVVGKKGLVTGGQIKAGSQIMVRTAGSNMGTVTVMEVGINPQISDRFTFVQQNMTELTKKKEQLEQLFELLGQKLKQGIRLPNDKIRLIKELPGKIKNISSEIDENSEEYFNLREQMDASSSGTVTIQNMAYPGVKIVIGGATKHIRSLEHHSRYYKEGGDIKSTAL